MAVGAGPGMRKGVRTMCQYTLSHYSRGHTTMPKGKSVPSLRQESRTVGALLKGHCLCKGTRADRSRSGTGPDATWRYGSLSATRCHQSSTGSPPAGLARAAKVLTVTPDERLRTEPSHIATRSALVLAWG